MLNTIENAIQIYNELADYSDIVLLHSRYYRSDRESIEQKAIDSLGKNSFFNDPNKGLILISTQLIEVGIDITSDLLISEICPPSSIIQRSGRCARFGGSGSIWIIDTTEINFDDDKEKLNFGPYFSSKEDTTSILNVKEYLNNKNLNEMTNFDYSNELIFLDNTMTKIDKVYFKNFSKIFYNFNEQLESDIDLDNMYKGHIYSKFIRDIDNISVILSQPGQLDDLNSKLSNGTNLEVISLNRKSIQSKIKKFLKENKAILGWTFTDNLEEENYEDFLKYSFEPLSPEQIYSDLIVLNTEYFDYNSETGLSINIKENQNGFNHGIKPYHKINKKFNKKFECETWKQHSNNTKLAYNLIVKRTRYATALISKNCDFPENDLLKIFELSVSLHDLGKLFHKWQKVAHEIQNSSIHKVDSSIALAHMTPSLIKKRLPPHSLEGGIVVYSLLNNYLKNYPNFNKELIETIKIVALRIISYHHGSKNVSPNRFDNLSFTKIDNIFHPDISDISNYNFIDILMKLNSILPNEDKFNKFKHQFINYYREIFSNFKSDKPERIVLTYFFVRILRLSDWYSFKFTS